MVTVTSDCWALQGFVSGNITGHSESRTSGPGKRESRFVSYTAALQEKRCIVIGASGKTLNKKGSRFRRSEGLRAMPAALGKVTAELRRPLNSTETLSESRTAVVRLLSPSSSRSPAVTERGSSLILFAVAKSIEPLPFNRPAAREKRAVARPPTLNVTTRIQDERSIARSEQHGDGAIAVGFICRG